MPNVPATPPLTLEVLRALANANPVIQIISTPTIATIELDMDIGMRGRLVSIRNDHDDVIKLMIDVSGFESVNKPCASATYFDKNQNPTLTWFESPCYPKDGKATIYMDADFYNADPFFALVSAESSALVAP